MKITLDQATLAKAVITHLRSVGVQSEILTVDFRYTRVPYTVFAEVELADAQTKPTATRVVVDMAKSDADETAEVLVMLPESLVDPDNLPPEEAPEEAGPPPEAPAAPLFGGS